VTDEIRGALIHFSSTLADAVPRIYRDLEEALQERFPADHFTAPSGWPGACRCLSGWPAVQPGSPRFSSAASATTQSWPSSSPR
jgi:phosphoenolpyruvate carboxylase